MKATVEELNQRLNQPAETVEVDLRRGSAVSVKMYGRRVRQLRVVVGRRMLAPEHRQTLGWRLAIGAARVESRAQFGGLGRALRLAGLLLLLLPIVEAGLALLWPASLPTRVAAAVLYAFGSEDRVAFVGGACVFLGLGLAQFGLWERALRSERKADQWGFATPASVVARSATGTPLHPRPWGMAAVAALVVIGVVVGWVTADQLRAVVVWLYGLEGSGIYMLSGRATFRMLWTILLAVAAGILTGAAWASAVRIAQWISARKPAPSA